MINELRGAMEKSIEVNGLNHPETIKLREMLDSHINSEQRDYSKESITNAEIKRGLLNQSLFRKMISEAFSPSRNQEVFEAAMKANELVEGEEDEKVSKITICLGGKTYISDRFLSAIITNDDLLVAGSCDEGETKFLTMAILDKTFNMFGSGKFLNYINTILNSKGLVAEIKVKEGESDE